MAAVSLVIFLSSLTTKRSRPDEWEMDASETMIEPGAEVIRVARRIYVGKLM
jgi:hypothetical protein